MYARYVPPAKGSTVPKNHESQPERQPVQAPTDPHPTTIGHAGYSYSRYIPGAKPAQKLDENDSIRHNEQEPPSVTKRKRDVEEENNEAREVERKKSKKAVDSLNQASEPHENLDDTKSSKKKKKFKKEKSNKKEGDDQPNAGGTQSEPPLSQTESPALEQSAPVAPEKRKKDKPKKSSKEKLRRSEREVNGEEEDSTEPHLNGNIQDQAGTHVKSPDVDSREESKKRKEKKKKKNEKREVDDTTAVINEDRDDSRHRAVLERKTKALKLASDTAQVTATEESPEPAELHGLEQLPQPEPAIVDSSKPSYETLPSWLAAPIRVSQNTRVPFTDLGLVPKAARVLEEKGYKEAFAVQTAAIPFLLPSSEHRAGDLLISAATGSGKTLAYALPIVRDISQGYITRLRALVVLPTRELVKQAQDVFELCAKAYEGGDRKRVRIGIAIGNQSLKYEQDTLMGSETRYDPEEYKRLQENTDSLPGYSAEESNPRLGRWDGEVVDFTSKVDVLICTPGRLVEHLDQTPGFSLDFVRWLVVDEADKLLAQSFQGWLDIVMEQFKVNIFSARDFPDMNFTGVRKVVLSATLTRDLSLLSQLSLKRPRLVVLEDETDAQIVQHSLPGTLKEFAVRVHNVNLKPLYLLDLLKGQHMKTTTAEVVQETEAESSTSDSGSSASSDSDSESSSDSSSDSDSEPEVSAPPATLIPVSLIFTKSNESALRLSRLLALLDKSLSTQISTLTSTTPSHTRRKTLRAFTTPSSPVRVIIASDLVARGIDLPKLDHVINYDLPPSVAGYVHRVGRTARAGRSGSAWTLVGDDESGWFWGKIAKGAGVRRAQKVERTRIEEMDEDRVQVYENALEELGKETLESRRR